MSKRRRNAWDEKPFEFTKHESQNHPPVNEHDDYDETFSEDVNTFLDDAHEALSKLMNKTNKRTKFMRGMRKTDAWQ